MYLELDFLTINSIMSKGLHSYIKKIKYIGERNFDSGKGGGGGTLIKRTKQIFGVSTIMFTDLVPYPLSHFLDL